MALRGIHQSHCAGHGGNRGHGVGHAGTADWTAAFEVLADLPAFRIVGDAERIGRVFLLEFFAGHAANPSPGVFLKMFEGLCAPVS